MSRIPLLDFTGSPGSLEIISCGNVGYGFRSPKTGIIRTSTGMPWSASEACSAAWRSLWVENDPPGMSVRRHPEAGWCFQVQGVEDFEINRYPWRSEARWAAWRWFRRRSHIGKALLLLGEKNAWPGMLAVPEGDCDVFEFWLQQNGEGEPPPVDLAALSKSVEEGSLGPMPEEPNLRTEWSIATISLGTALRRLQIGRPLEHIKPSMERVRAAIHKIGLLTEEMGPEDDGPVMAQRACLSACLIRK